MKPQPPREVGEQRAFPGVQGALEETRVGVRALPNLRPDLMQ
jgi:hypothetical protein